jgi:hypothetical protein
VLKNYTQTYSVGVIVIEGASLPVNGRLFKKLTLLLAINQAITKMMAIKSNTKK